MSRQILLSIIPEHNRNLRSAAFHRASLGSKGIRRMECGRLCPAYTGAVFGLLVLLLLPLWIKVLSTNLHQPLGTSYQHFKVCKHRVPSVPRMKLSSSSPRDSRESSTIPREFNSIYSIDASPSGSPEEWGNLKRTFLSSEKNRHSPAWAGEECGPMHPPMQPWLAWGSSTRARELWRVSRFHRRSILKELWSLTAH